MATRTITYTAWDTSANTPKTGDVGNHTIVVIADGVSAAADGTPAEVNNGEYSLVLSAAEWAANTITVTGSSSTGSVVIIPVKIIKGPAVDAIAELSVAVPSTTPSLMNAVMLMYMALRNKLRTQTSGTDALEIHNDAGTIICKKLISDDNEDYTEDKMISG